MKKTLILMSTFLITFLSANICAEDNIELKTTIIKGNKELPKILYLVPWQDMKKTKSDEQGIVLHSLFGDLFDPVEPEEFQY